DRRGQPSLNAAHRDAHHADPFRVDVIALFQNVDQPPEVPNGVVIERMLHLVLRRSPSGGDGGDVSLRTFGTGNALAMITGIDGDADDAAAGEIGQPSANAFLAAA